TLRVLKRKRGRVGPCALKKSLNDELERHVNLLISTAMLIRIVPGSITGNKMLTNSLNFEKPALNCWF
uniref:hypothetical protein n=1 Tax=uncultured Pseudomonas sp. TaxID=114707 RepID=UPI00258F6FA0